MVSVEGSSENGVDVFDASDALQYISRLTVDLMIAGGLAKAGNRVQTNHA